ncbi:MAG TPA: protein-L-isoaspartate(D-aspartate) O-methyltransferase [Rubrivivax sp.]|nr:protein-L-isoaspartate(D-aspartate) O-methyltransferase [Rubrivivax sp.]
MQDSHETGLRRMLDEVRADFGDTAWLTGCARPSAAVEAALAAVPRHRFVPEAWRLHAYENRPLPIGHGQTISQPFIVALMTELLALKPGARVLEIGTGCGWQAAVLAAMGAQVTSLEIVPALAKQAAATLAELGIRGVEVHEADGHAGWPAGAPYDGIIATAAAPELPAAWTEQLAPGGRLVAPLGTPGGDQGLVLLHKHVDGRTERREVLGVRFVPLTGRTP